MTLAAETAYQLAVQAHEGQTYGEHPYIWHCEQAARELISAGITADDLLAAAWLHDVLEDTALTREQIAESCGAGVADLVYACTGVGKNRRERNAGIAERVKLHPRAALVKVADRVANMRECLRTEDGRWGMYLREAPAFRAAVCEVALAAGGEALVDVFDALVRGPRP